jgi:predicted nucleic-acid-binding Zn-ribbon protein
MKKRKCPKCDVTEYNEDKYFICAKCGFINIGVKNDKFKKRKN